MEHFFSRIKSHYIISVNTLYPEKIINILQNNGIYLWDIKYENNVLSFKAFNDSMDIVNAAAERFASSACVSEKLGCERLYEYFKGKKAFFYCAVFVLILIVVFSRFIWEINIYGTRNIKPNDIMQYLYSQNIKQSVSRRKIDTDKLSSDILSNFNSLSEAVVELKGTSLYITVVEKDSPIVLYDKSIPVNIIASEDGYVDEIEVYNGTQLVIAGTMVKKGDVIISGTVEYDSGEAKEMRYVHAMGKVLMHKECNYDDIRIESVVANEKAPYIAQKTFFLFSTTIDIDPVKDKNGKMCKEQLNIPFVFAGIQFPVLYNEKRWYNISDCKYKSEADIAKEVNDAVNKRLNDRCTIKDVTYTVTGSEKYKLTVSANVKYTESIAVEQKIDQ